MNDKQAIEFLKICEEPLAVETRKMLISLIESLAADAELGRAAVECIRSGYTEVCLSSKIMDAECEEDCGWYKFCRLRAGKGGE